MTLQSFKQSDAQAFEQSAAQARHTLGPASLWAVNLTTNKIDWIWDSGGRLNGVAIVGDDLWVVGPGSSSYDGATTGLGHGVAWKMDGLSNTVELALSDISGELGTTIGNNVGLAITGDGGKGVSYSTDVFLTVGRSGGFSDWTVRLDPSTGSIVSSTGTGLLAEAITTINSDAAHYGPASIAGTGYTIQGNIFGGTRWIYATNFVGSGTPNWVTNDGTNIWISMAYSTNRAAHTPLSNTAPVTIQKWDGGSTAASGQILYQANLNYSGAMTATTDGVFVGSDTSTDGTGYGVQKLAAISTTGTGTTSDVDWTYETGSVITAIALTTSGDIVAGGSTGRMFLITDESTPSLVWERALPQGSTQSEIAIADVATRGNYAYFATSRYIP
jgi:hypothetical protein